MRDRGQAVLLVLAVVACCALAAIGVAGLGEVLIDRQEAQAAADAAALAGITGGREAAAALASANGGRLVAFDAVDAPDGSTTVTVVVRVGETQARARASDGP